MAEAVLFADVRNYSGTGPLLNQGISGSALNLELGSTSGADTNDPLWLPFTGEPYAYFPAGTYNRIYYDLGGADYPTGDIEIKTRQLTWTGADGSIMFFAGSSGNTIHFRIGGGIYYYGINSYASQPAISVSSLPINTPFWFRSGFKSGIFYWDWGVDGVNWNNISTAGAPMTLMPISAIYFGTDSSYPGWPGYFYSAEFNYPGGKVVWDAKAPPSDALQRATGKVRKSVLIQSRPTFLLGSDDYFRIPVGQDGALNFGANQPFTAMGFWRRWGPTDYYARGLDKQMGLPTGPGWTAPLFDTGNRNSLFQVDSVTTFYGGGLSAPPDGVIEMAGGRRRADMVIETIGSIGASAGSAVPGDLTNTREFRIGATALDMSQCLGAEFYGAAVFRRELTAEEVKDVCAYFGAS